MVVHTWGFVQSRPGSPWVKVELRAEPGAVFRVSGRPYAAALSSFARIRSALQSMDVRWPGKALTLHVHPALRAGEINELDVPVPHPPRVAGPTLRVKARPRRGCASAPNSGCMPCSSVRPGWANPHSSARPTPCFLQAALSPRPFSHRTLPEVWAGCSGLCGEERLCLVRGHRPTAGCCFSTNSQNGRGPQENRCGTSWTPAPFNCTGQKDRPIGPRTHGLWPP